MSSFFRITLPLIIVGVIVSTFFSNTVLGIPIVWLMVAAVIYTTFVDFKRY